MANDKDDTYYNNKIINDKDFFKGETKPLDELKEKKSENVPPPGQLFSDFISGQGGRQDIEKTGTSFTMPESKKVKGSYTEKIENDREHD